MSFPRVLIFGQPFNNFTGGGITLSNLFKGWPKDRVAVAFIGHGLFNITTDICDTYYQLGQEEHKWTFPFNLIQRKFPSGLKNYGKTEIRPPNFIQVGMRYRLVNGFFYPFLRWIGLFHTVSRIKMSDRFRKWLDDYKPEVLYLQVSTRETLLFATELSRYLKIPSIIHVMDDWPSTISRHGLFKNYWHSRIDREFKSLLSGVNLHLSISDAMSEEYLKRYGIDFIPFHNPIEIGFWLPETKKNFSIKKNVAILYSGRLGDQGITGSLVEVAAAIDSLPASDYRIKLHIQTPTRKKSIIDQLSRFRCVEFNTFVEYSQLPKIFSKADILLLANDFTPQGIDYLRYSMPTKASEYMISGTPVLVYASGETAVSKFFNENECGLCVTSGSREALQKAITYIVSDEDYRKRISGNAVTLAKNKFSADKVRNDFQIMLRQMK